MQDHPYGWLSIVPPLATVAVALLTRRVLVSLLLGIAAGALITSGGAPLPAVYHFFETHLWSTLIDPGKLRVLCFTLLMGAMIGVLNAGGGMRGLVELLTPLINSTRRCEVVTWFLGLVVFFDDYTNTLLLGNTMRATFDRLKLSREKLAYIVDSTAAPVACLAPFSVWVLFELECIQDGINNIDPSIAARPAAMDLFIACLPYRFYVILALALVLLVALLRRDIGPMVKAERHARLGDPTKGTPVDDAPPIDQPATHWSNALGPILVTLAVVIALILVGGRAALSPGDQSAEQAAELVDEPAPQAAAGPSLIEIVGAADASVALMYGALVGLFAAAALLLVRGVLTTPQIQAAAFNGVRMVLPALAILWFAGTMSRMTGNRGAEGQTQTVAYEFQDYRLYTGDYLKELLPQGDETGAGSTTALLPSVVFLLACLVAFATGTSFGTMGILLPFVVPVSVATIAVDGVFDPHHPLLLASIGSVLAGAIFGDHCSPISDTTILSSQASGCDHMAHVVTQMPYAISAGLVSAVGVAAVGYGAGVWLVLPAQVAGLVVILLVFGQRVEDAAQVPG
ncbi:Malate-2H(+)/Na(+)-lactate antiporter [Posidoniimonas polymericola]|uniref:Malate-2H(+)/Na(+)-lactate antiporter n=1 Tax=Posidoniimonas polymericola TaxID=2528002 RepID=A0A5C5XV65_9BACT|nr:Na+/H+ antiporter NhaC family protein [Posidoniimonas polymericola]TWT66770.1 Malate-2H(+)/Na(+)-lactate antiporter [Posidoniimonas polymericola]